MTERAKAPRFPYVAALLCVACIGAAGWTWMRYSYCWDAMPGGIGGLQACYVRVQGRLAGKMGTGGRLRHYLRLVSREAEESRVPVVQTEEQRAKPIVVGTQISVRGRVVELREIYEAWGVSPRYIVCPYPVVLPGASRFTGASIAGLVVGAMGVFVFSAALRHWLGERRAAREAA